MKTKEELDAYLARIRKTVADSRNLVSQVELRFAETDRLLERQGLTREQVRNMRLTDGQREMANRELARRGLDPIEFDASPDEIAGSASGGWDAVHPHAVAQDDAGLQPSNTDGEFSGDDSELANRRMKFSMMMKPFRI